MCVIMGNAAAAAPTGPFNGSCNQDLYGSWCVMETRSIDAEPGEKKLSI
jgi:hypothetical protein